jgi:hypothetical protein
MCLQCITNASTYGKITSKYALMQSELDDEEWPVGYLGLVQENDPTFIFKAPPRNPYFYKIDFEYNDYEKYIYDVYSSILEEGGEVSSEIKEKYNQSLINFCEYVYNNNLSLCVGDIFILEDILNEFYYDFDLDNKFSIHTNYERNLLFNVWFFGYIAEFIHTVDKLVEPYPQFIGEAPIILTDEQQKENEVFYKKLNEVYITENRHKEIFDLIIKKIEANTHPL